MRRRDLHAAGAEFAFDVFIGDDRDGAPRQWQRDHFADKRGVTRVLGIHGDRDVAQHRLRTRCGHDEGFPGRATRSIGERIAYFPELPLHLLAFHFEVGHGRTELGIPMHQSLAAVDEAVLMQADECLPDRGGEAVIHREALTRPVGGRAHASHLVRYSGTGLFLPRPYALDELFAPKVVPGFAFGLQLLLDDDLRGDARVIRAHLPQRVVAAHPVVADHQVHQRLLERVAHVQRAGDVGRRQLNAERRRVRLHRRLEIPARLPQRVPLGLNGMRIEALGEFHAESDR